MTPCAETPIHIAIYEFLRAVLPGSRVVHCPNGGQRNKAEAAQLSRMGVLAGFPDLMILTGCGATLFIEVKNARGKLSSEQDDFAKFCAAAHFPFGVCRSVEDARAFLAANAITTREAA